MKLRRAIVTLVLALTCAAIIALAARAVHARAARDRAFERAAVDMRCVGCSRDVPYCAAALIELDDPRAIPVLAEAYPRWRGDLLPELRHAVELFATTPEPRDPRPRAALERLARDATLDVDERMNAFLLLDELESPRYPPEPLGASAARVRIELGPGAIEPTLDRLGLAVDMGDITDGECVSIHQPFVIEDRAHRALVRLAQVFDHTHVLVSENGRHRFTREKREDGVLIYPRLFDGSRVLDRRDAAVGTTVSLVPGAPFEELLARRAERELVVVPPATIAKWPRLSFFTNPLATLRALAALNGCAVRERDAKIVEIYRP